VPASVVEVLADALGHVQRGEHVRVIADDEDITTQQAADLLDVSRPYLVGLVDRGELPSRKVGARRRLRLATSSSTGTSTRPAASRPLPT